MQRLLDELLGLSRVGRQVNPPEKVPFGELVAEARELVAGEIRERGVEVTVAPGLPVVVGDRARLLEVVQNLLQNAVKYMGDQPSPRLEVGVREGGADEVLYVRDNGARSRIWCLQRRVKAYSLASHFGRLQYGFGLRRANEVHRPLAEPGVDRDPPGHHEGADLAGEILSGAHSPCS